MCAAYRSPKSVCSVFNCNFRTSYSNQNHIQLYSFPRKGTIVNGEDLLFKWIEAVKLSRKFTKDMKVCSRHFKEEDFLKSDNTQMLKSSAIPSLNLPLVWRNKFYPRDYGRLIKLLEFRGIGRLRLCYEAKLGRRIRQAEERMRKKAKIKSKKKDENLVQTEKRQNCHSESTDLLKLSSAFSLASESLDQNTDKSLNNTNQKEIEESLTSEIMIKEEPLSDPEEGEIEILDKEETVEEMLARMNEDSNEIPQTNNNDENRHSRLNESSGTDGTICDDCGQEDCQGRHEERLECYPCKKIFMSARQLTGHNLSHFEYTNTREMVCKLCSQTVSPDVTMSEHMNQKHSRNKSHVCMLCDKAFRFKSSLMHHVNSHAVLTLSHRCKVCREYFDSSEKLDDHVKTHRAIKREYTCRQCGEKFTSKYSCWTHLNSHMRSTSKTGIACQVCGRVLSTRATLKEHTFIHSGEKPFECQLCGRKIRHRANFIIHVQGHSLGQPHLCLTCGMGFAKKSELNSHVAAEHPEDRPHHCIICGLRFRTETRFLKHAVSHDAYLVE